MDINNLADLKAYAYDLIGQIETLQKELQAVNGLVAKKMKEQQEEKKEEVKDDKKK